MNLKTFIINPLFKNAILLIARGAIGAGLGFFFWAVATNNYSSDDIGIANALFSTITFLSIVSSLGLHMGLIRFLPTTANKQDVVNSCITITGVLSLISAIVFVAGLPLWSPQLSELRDDIWFTLAFVVLNMCFTIHFIMKFALLAQRYAGWTLVLDVIWKASAIILLIAFIDNGALGVFSSWLTVFPAAIMGIYLFAKHNKGYRLFLGFNVKIIRPMARFSFDSYLADGLMNAPAFLLPLIIVNILDSTQNAYFAIAYAIAGILFMIPKGTFTSLFVEGSHSADNLYANIVKSIKFVFILLFISIVLIFVLGDKMLLIFGKEYQTGALYTLKLLSLSSIFLAVNELYIAVRRIQLKTRPIIYVYLVMVVLTIMLCTILGIQKDLQGIALGWIIAQGLVAVGTGGALLRERRHR